MFLTEAVSQFVHDGDTVYAAGFTHMIPFAAGHEINRQDGKISPCAATPDLIYTNVAAAAPASDLFLAGNPGVGSLRILREELESGRLAWEEYSHYGMISRLQAGASGLSFFPMNSTAAGDLERSNPQYRRITDPYSGREVVTVPGAQP